MKTGSGTVALMATMLLGGWAWAGSEDTNQLPQPLCLELDLVDGAFIIGIPKIESVPLQTDYANLKIPLKRIAVVKIADAHGTASLDLRNGDKLKGVIAMNSIELTTVFGPVKIGIEYLREIAVVSSAEGLPANSLGMEFAPIPVTGEGKDLAARLRSAAKVHTSAAWGELAGNASHSTSSAVLTGRGYAMKLHFSRYPDTNGVRDHRLPGALVLAVAEGDIRYSLQDIRWTRIRDDKGNDLMSAWQRQRNSEDHDWWSRQKAGVEAVRPDTKESLANFELSLADLSATEIRVLEGVLYVVFATKWDTVVVDLQNRGRAFGLFEHAGLSIAYLGYETRGNRSGYFFRLTPEKGYTPLPYSVCGDPHGLSFDLSAGVQRHSSMYFGTWSRDADGWVYWVEAQSNAVQRMRIDMLVRGAVVGLPFAFRNVKLPGTPLPP